MNELPQSIKELGTATLTKVADKFVDFIIVKYTGKSIKVFEAEGDIEADKVKSKWEVLEKPFWLQAEATKMGRQYSNLGDTLLKAVPIISATENNISEDNDLFWGLLEYSKEISNEEVQGLIAKIIAGEYNNPGTYSMSTLQTIKMLGKNELELFQNICSLLISDEYIPQNLFNMSEDARGFMNKLSVDFGRFQIFQSLGLFLPNSMTKAIPNPNEEEIDFMYFDQKVTFIYESEIHKTVHGNETRTTIQLPAFYGLSTTGRQIKQHLNPVYNADYFVWLKKNYKIPNYKLVE